MVLKALQKVFVMPAYILLSSVVGLGVFMFAVWLPNIGLIIRFMGHSNISLSQKINLPISLLGSITTNFTLLSATYTIAIAVLFGINVSMLAYYLRRKITDIKKNGIASGLLGIASGILGIGCAACGSLLLTAVLSFFGASWILSLLPFRGGEFGILGVILLLFALNQIAKQIQNPMVCRQ